MRTLITEKKTYYWFYRAGLHRTTTLASVDTNANSDWNYSSDLLTRQSESTNSGAASSRSTNSRPSSPQPDNQLTQFISTTTDASSLHEKSFIQCNDFCVLVRF